jgi:hypothetical protein
MFCEVMEAVVEELTSIDPVVKVGALVNILAQGFNLFIENIRKTFLDYAIGGRTI